jgi:hypothetical protein
VKVIENTHPIPLRIFESIFPTPREEIPISILLISVPLNSFIDMRFPILSENPHVEKIPLKIDIARLMRIPIQTRFPKILVHCLSVMWRDFSNEIFEKSSVSIAL